MIFDNFSIAFAADELKKLISKGSFASYLVTKMGNELRATIEYLDEAEGGGYWGHHPVQALYELLADGWSLDREYLLCDDGVYRDDRGDELSPSVARTYSPAEIMAAYGLHFLDEISSHGELPVSGYNNHGWTREEIAAHEAECLLRGYQALVYAQKLIIGEPLVPPTTVEEFEKAARISTARKAAEAMHDKPWGTRTKKRAVIDYWEKNIGRDKSNEFAAERLQKEFPGIAHRTLALYVAEAKKLPPASTL